MEPERLERSVSSLLEYYQPKDAQDIQVMLKRFIRGYIAGYFRRLKWMIILDIQV